MRIFAYSVREDEEKYMEAFRSKDVELEYISDYPSMENVDCVNGFDAVSIITNVVTKEMYDAWYARGVRYIATRSIGFDHLDTAYMKQLGMRGVHATYSPNAVANYTIMLMLMACRKVNLILDKAKHQDFSLNGKIGKELSLCTVGVIGTGQIGECVIKHLSGFGCRILANARHPKEELKDYAEYVDLDTLLRESDIVTLHIPGNDDNYHLIGKEAFAKMKDDAIFINTARGMCVDSYALIEALATGEIGFACIDTCEAAVGLHDKKLEYTRLENRVRTILSGLENVIFTPHMAFYTEQSTSDMVGTTNRGLRDLFETGESDHEVSYR